MSWQDLTSRFPSAARFDDLPVVEPSADLWQRIEQAHRARIRSARRRRIGAMGAFSVAVALIAGGVAVQTMRMHSGGAIDWQARAQALELQLRALDAGQPVEARGGDADGELVRVDAALQAAYDNGGDRQQLDALWKRRSELLNVLVRARTQNLEISRI